MHWGCSACGGSNPEGTRFCGHCGQARETAAEKARDERRLITALFADISGFTSLADRLDAEHLHAVIAPVIATLAGVAEGYGGTLAKYAGDAVLVFFGAPVAQEDHATRALLCALDMHRVLDESKPKLPPEAASLELHVGVNSGRVVAGLFGGDIRSDYSILGDAVNVAQRLESVAPAGATYVGETTVNLAGAEFVLEPLGELTLKGKAKSVAAWRLEGAAATEAEAATVRPALVGRDHELSEIRAIIDRGAGVVCLTAEAGCGKTRLTDEVRSLSRSSGARWIDGRCPSYGTSLAYWPFVDLVRRAYGVRIEQDPNRASQLLADGLEGHGVAHVMPYFARLLGLPAPPGAVALGTADTAGPNAAAFARGLRDSFVAWLAGLAGGDPLVVAIEDLHWADSASVELIGALAEVIRDERIVLYLTGRPDAVPVIDRIAASFTGERRTVIALVPLDRAATAEVVKGITGRAADETLVATVFERAGGNPFFTGELVRTFQDTGALDVVDGLWALRPGWDLSALPPTIEGVLGARIDLLPAATAAVLQTAAVIGRRVDLGLLVAVAEGFDLTRTVDRLVVAGFLDRSAVDGRETIMFHHALVVDVAYSRLMTAERRSLHRRVAEAGEELYGSGEDVIDLLARHFYLAEAGVKAVQYIERAAARAERLFANEETILHLTHALELAGRTERVATHIPVLTLKLAQVEDRVGHLAKASRLYTDVQVVTNDVEAWRGLASVARRSGDLVHALEIVDAAFAHVSPDVPDLLPLWLERVWALTSEGHYTEAIEAGESGLAATSEPEGLTAGQTLLQMSNAELRAGRTADALGHAVRALRIFETGGDIHGLTVALRVLGTVHNEEGDVDDAAAALRRGLELAEKTGTVEEIAGCLVNLGQVELRRRNLEDAATFTERAVRESQRVGHSVGAAVAQGNLAEILFEMRDLDRARSACSTAIELASTAGVPAAVGDAQRTMAAVHLEEGDWQGACHWAERAATVYLDFGDEPNAASCLSIAVSAAGRGGDAARARSFSDRALALHGGAPQSQ